MTTPLLLLTSASLIACVGVGFAATDAAVSAISESRLRALLAEPVENNDVMYRGLRRYARDPHGVLARLLTARILCIVGATVLTAEVAFSTTARSGANLGGSGFLTFAAVSLIYITLAEVGASFARRHPVAVGDGLLRLMFPLEIAVMPIAAPLERLGRAIAHAARPSSEPAFSARVVEAEVEYLIEHGSKTGALDDAELLRAAVDFKDARVGSVMVPRTRMVALDAKTSLARVVEIVALEGHSRYPVFEGQRDEIVGLLYVKDVFRVVRDGRTAQTSLASLIRKPVLFAQVSQPVTTVLKEMRAKRLHMAIVNDDYGGTAGIVTLEDILELLVGDIQDEHDTEHGVDDAVQELGEGRWMVDAALAVDELGDRLGMTFPKGEGFVSVGGLLMEQLGRVPEAGVRVRFGPVDLLVRDSDERRVRRVEVVRHDNNVDLPS